MSHNEDVIKADVIPEKASLPECLSNHMLDPTLINTELQTPQPAAVMLNFTMQRQTQSNWCWAAVSASVGNFYGTGGWTQCGVATAELGRNCCSQPGPCNVYGYLDSSLRTTRSFNRMLSSRIQLSEITNQISQGRPVGLRCAWYGGGAHFLTIYGISGNYINVADSIYGYATYALNSFPANYQGGGNWTHTYYTQKNLGGA